MMKKRLFVMISVGLMAGASAQDEKREDGAVIGGDAAAVAAEEAAKPKDMSKILNGQLIVADGDKVKSADFDEGMEYYLVYHSASW